MTRIKKREFTPRVSINDDLESAIKKIVGHETGKHKGSGDILRAGAPILSKIANDIFDPKSESAIAYLADRFGLGARQLLRLHLEFADGEIWKTTTILMAAERSALTLDSIQRAFRFKPDAEEIKRSLPSIYAGMQHFVREEHMEEFIRMTATPTEPGSSRRQSFSKPRPEGEG